MLKVEKLVPLPWLVCGPLHGTPYVIAGVKDCIICQSHLKPLSCCCHMPGVLGPKDIFGGQGGAIQQLQQLASILQQQSTHQFFSSSVLVTFEGAACTAEDAQVRVSLVDFAHVFPSQGEIDHNFLDGLQSLITTVQQTI